MTTGSKGRGRPQRDLLGLKFGYLLPMKRFTRKTASGNSVVYWECVCTGNHFYEGKELENRVVEVPYANLHQGGRRSCGCVSERRKDVRGITDHSTPATPEDYTKVGLPVPQVVLDRQNELERALLERSQPMTVDDLMNMDDGIPWIDTGL